jgi:hypothetical protein
MSIIKCDIACSTGQVCCRFVYMHIIPFENMEYIFNYASEHARICRRDKYMEASRLYVSSANPFYADPEQSEFEKAVCKAMVNLSLILVDSVDLISYKACHSCLQ